MATVINPELFERAADEIERVGWWNGTPQSAREDGSHPTCIANAVGRVTDIEETIDYAIDILLMHFGFDKTNARGLFALNDRQPPDTGQQWAVNNLREVASKLRKGWKP